MRPGDFGFQMAGIAYREGLVEGGEDPLWMFAIHGDRRGARSTTTRHDGSFELGEVAKDQLDRPVPSTDDPYWRDVPGGDRGVSALAVSQGRTVGGFHWCNFSESKDWQVITPGVQVCAALFGDAEVGPMILAIRADPDAKILPRHSAATEILIVPVAGSVAAGMSCLSVGDVRIIPASHGVDALVAGPAGANILYMIADRRAAADIVALDGRGDTMFDACRTFAKMLGDPI
ncbi:hypothetical protein A7Q26_02035 [Sphingobium sp. TCM1]|nr:hypothetical protein A7Q26_02035 [Sphingobium sp. TCM1]